jgi:hypothetical protein
VEPSQQCQDGVTRQDSVDVLNANNYFGASNWEFLDRVDTNGDRSNLDFWRVSGAARGLPSGSFKLAEGIWDKYKVLAVALKGGGAYPVGSPVGTPAVNWSLYQLVNGQDLYDWVYGATRSGMLRNLFTITLYGIARPVGVAEPMSLALLALGAGGLMLVLRRRPVAVQA